MEILQIIFLVFGGIALGIIITLLYIYSLLSKMDARLTITIKQKTEGDK